VEEVLTILQALHLAQFQLFQLLLLQEEVELKMVIQVQVNQEVLVVVQKVDLLDLVDQEILPL
tara:strand:+ start:45 stop:233 length:189 start_codon:yes stop_codon:yes gene_type:complete